MAEDRTPSKQDLLDALERASKLIADQGAALEAAAVKAAEHDKAIEELKAQVAAKPFEPAPEAGAPPKVVPKPGPQAIPYEGLVRAKEACHVGHLRAPGDVWHHKADVLWSDDPFEPVIQRGTDRDGNPILELHPEAPEPMPFELRPRSHEALAARAARPQRASDW